MVGLGHPLRLHSFVPRQSTKKLNIQGPQSPEIGKGSTGWVRVTYTQVPMHLPSGFMTPYIYRPPFTSIFQYSMPGKGFHNLLLAGCQALMVWLRWHLSLLPYKLILLVFVKERAMGHWLNLKGPDNPLVDLNPLNLFVVTASFV